MSKIKGQKVPVSSLEKNDLFYMTYGVKPLKFRVHEKVGEGVLAHSVKWMKSNNIFIAPEVEFQTPLSHAAQEVQYAGKISKLRAFFML